MKKLNYKKMIEEVNELVNVDFTFEMECKGTSTYITYAEAEQMRLLLLQIYMIAHCVECTGCQTKYLL